LDNKLKYLKKEGADLRNIPEWSTPDNFIAWIHDGPLRCHYCAVELVLHSKDEHQRTLALDRIKTLCNLHEESIQKYGFVVTDEVEEMYDYTPSTVNIVCTFCNYVRSSVTVNAYWDFMTVLYGSDETRLRLRSTAFIHQTEVLYQPDMRGLLPPTVRLEMTTYDFNTFVEEVARDQDFMSPKELGHLPLVFDTADDYHPRRCVLEWKFQCQYRPGTDRFIEAMRDHRVSLSTVFRANMLDVLRVNRRNLWVVTYAEHKSRNGYMSPAEWQARVNYRLQRMWNLVDDSVPYPRSDVHTAWFHANCESLRALPPADAEYGWGTKSPSNGGSVRSRMSQSDFDFAQRGRKRKRAATGNTPNKQPRLGDNDFGLHIRCRPATEVSPERFRVVHFGPWVHKPRTPKTLELASKFFYDYQDVLFANDDDDYQKSHDASTQTTFECAPTGLPTVAATEQNTAVSTSTVRASLTAETSS
jgi:hypothetical protein